MHHIPLMKAAHLIPYTTYLQQQGISFAKEYDQARLPWGSLEAPDSLVPIHSVIRMYGFINRKIGTNNMMWEIAQSVDFSDWGRFGQLFLREPTLFSAINAFKSQVRTQSSDVHIELTRSPRGGYYFNTHYLSSITSQCWDSSLFALEMKLKMVRLAKPDFQPKTIWLNVPTSPERTHFLQQRGFESIFFSSNNCGFEIPPNLISAPLHHAAPPISSSSSEDSSVSIPISGPYPEFKFSNSLRQVIHSYSRDSWLTIEEAAEIISMSPRTLQRRLAEDDLNYFNMIDRLKFEKATQLLLNTELKMQAISQILGYQSPANFTRAFNRWAGVTPRAYRLQNQEQKQEELVSESDKLPA